MAPNEAEALLAACRDYLDARQAIPGTLKRWRKANGIKQEVVAAALDCTISNVSRLENGQFVSRPKTLRKLIDMVTGFAEGQAAEPVGVADDAG